MHALFPQQQNSAWHSLTDMVTTAFLISYRQSTDSSATSVCHMLVRHSLSLVHRHGTLCRNVYVTLLTALLFLASSQSMQIAKYAVYRHFTLHYIWVQTADDGAKLPFPMGIWAPSNNGFLCPSESPVLKWHFDHFSNLQGGHRSLKVLE